MPDRANDHHAILNGWSVNRCGVRDAQYLHVTANILMPLGSLKTMIRAAIMVFSIGTNRRTDAGAGGGGGNWNGPRGRAPDGRVAFGPAQSAVDSRRSWHRQTPAAETA